MSLSLDPTSRVSAPDLTKLLPRENGWARAVDAAAARTTAWKTFRARQRTVIFATEEIQMASTNGTIKRLVSDKGFGFVAASDGND